MSKRSQSAMEFLMSYSWAIFVLLLVMAALVWYGLSSSDSRLPDRADVGTGITIIESSVSQDVLSLLIKNTDGRKLHDLQVNVTECQDGAGTWSQPVSISNGDSELVTVYCETGMEEGETFKSDLKVNYSTTGGGTTLPKTKKGKIVAGVKAAIISCNDLTTDPVFICNCEQLESIGNNLGLNYELAVDIDCSDTINWDTGSGFDPIGGTFTGTFNGAGNIIDSLYINRPALNDAGLFGKVSGTINNTGLLFVNVTGADNTGALVGYLTGGIVDNSYAFGYVYGEGEVGGLIGVGYPTSTIDNSYASVAVRLTEYHGGGLVGYLSGDVDNSYATGDVIAFDGAYANGGLVGYFYSGVINNSNASGTVNGTDYVGGLAAFVSGTIENSFATGDVSSFGSGSGQSYTGGLVGSLYGTIDNTYATGNVESDGDYVGGLIGFHHSGVNNNSYATGIVTSTGSYFGGVVGNLKESFVIIQNSSWINRSVGPGTISWNCTGNGTPYWNNGTNCYVR